MRISFKSNYSIMGKLVYESGDATFNFRVPIENEQSVAVCIRPSQGDCDGVFTCNVSDELAQRLTSEGNEPWKWSDGLKSELNAAFSTISAAARRVFDCLKYYLSQGSIDDQLFGVKSHHWSVDKDVWNWMPILGSVVGREVYQEPLTPKTAEFVQQFIDASRETFVSLQHLHRARQESSPRHRWIDATIAAELAIKEFLIRLRPEIAPVLLHCPSPPLHKLYGEILESFVQERSPKLKQVNEGVQRRNELVHKPESKRIHPQEAANYVHDMEVAIYHLLTLLYPNDPVICDLYRRMTPDAPFGTKQKGKGG